MPANAGARPGFLSVTRGVAAGRMRRTNAEEAMDARTLLSVAAIAALLAVAGCAHEPRHDPQPTPVDLQGAGESNSSTHMRDYYDLTAAPFANATDIDVDAADA